MLGCAQAPAVSSAACLLQQRFICPAAKVEPLPPLKLKLLNAAKTGDLTLLERQQALLTDDVDVESLKVPCWTDFPSRTPVKQ